MNKKLIFLVLLTIAIVFNMGDTTTRAFVSPIESPLPIPICPRCEGATICDSERGWITIKHSELGWCKICSYDECKNADEQSIEKTSSIAIDPTPIVEQWVRLDDWMDQYPLWSNGQTYCVEIDGYTCPPK